MSTPNGQPPNSNYVCHNCGHINPIGTICSQCQSESLEEISTNSQRQLINTNDDQQIPLIQQFQNLFHNDFNLQTFTNMLLPMLMFQIQSEFPQYHHRRGRLPRRIKRIINNRYLPISEIRLVNLNSFLPRQILNNQQLFIFDQNNEIFRQLSNEDRTILPITRSDINQLPTLTMTPSNLSLNPSCAICLENFDLSSEVKQIPTCHHIFHRNCLTEWLLRHGNCPMCRTVISSNQQVTQIPIFNNQWLQQLFLQTFGQPIKAINPSQISSDSSTSNHSSDDTPQLPRFDSE